MVYTTQRNNDSGTLLQRYLEQSIGPILTKRYPALHGASGEDVPINTGLEVGVQELVEEVMSERGSADLVDFAADDFPTVDVDLQERRFPLKVYGVAFRYNDREILTAERRGKISLRDARIRAARRKLETKINYVVYYGERRVEGFTGLLNNPDVPSQTLTAVNYYSQTPDTVARMLFDIVNAVDEETNMVEEANVLLVPNTFYNYIATTRMGDGSDTTILQFFLQNMPSIRAVRRRNELRADMLQSHGIENDGNHERIVVMSLSPETLQRFVEPVQVTQPLRLSLMNWTVGMYTVTSPVIVHYPKALRYVRIKRRGA